MSSSISDTIRVRFAPSPTGFLHVGGLRTALYNYLFARKHGGTFVLRIEDTDRSRFVEGAVENLIDTLRWAGLNFDEGPVTDGTYGPYVQSERLETYRRHVDLLMNARRAYRCFCPPERLEQMRKSLEKARLFPKYDRRCLGLSEEEIGKNLSEGIPSVVRMRVPDGNAIRFHDLIRGEVEFAAEGIDDQVLLKSDGYPTYHLANVVDDHLMKITHVIRGEEWLPSTPKHVILYDDFAWPRPVFAHLPLLLNADRSKLSKRQGDVAVEEYRAKGYLKEALVNFVALLGWNPGTPQEVFSMQELIDQFLLEGVHKAGAIFNVEKLDWLNFEHLKRMSDDDVLTRLKAELSVSRFREGRFSDEYLRSVITSMRERMSFVKDIIEKSPYFFERPRSFDPEVAAKRWTDCSAEDLTALAAEFESLERCAKEDFEIALQKVAATLNVKPSVLIHPLRLAISGVGGGPGVYDILAIIGKRESVERIRAAIEQLNTTERRSEHK